MKKTEIQRIKENNNAITLIALVITMILLLILAGISITMLTKENGLIKNTRRRKRTGTNR